MKITVELDCTPEEARKMMGLPDVNKLNDAYVKEVSKFLQGSNSVEQLQNFTKMVTPMGEAGLKMFSTFLGGAMSGNATPKKARSSPKSTKKKSED